MNPTRLRPARIARPAPIALALFAGVLVLATAGALDAWGRAKGAAPGSGAIPEVPKGLEPIPSPADNPTTADKVALGHLLFFDKRLSVDGSRSCYSCHVCEKGLTDGLPIAVGAAGKKLTRSSPTLWNIGYHTEFYWDGRSGSLEKQALAAWSGGNMGADPNKIAADLNAIPAYKERFQKVFGSDATPDAIVKAISAYERTILCGTTRFDRFGQGDKSALTDAEKRGHEIFKGKGQCVNCHVGALLTDFRYHNVGIGMDKAEPDPGRKKVTNDEAHTGAFKTPTLRDISRSAPYFHDGSVATLEEAVNLMAGGGRPNTWLDVQNLADRKLTAAEKADLVAFLKSLDCECGLTEPKLP